MNAINKDNIPSEWIMVSENKFVCSECENEAEPLTMGTEGLEKANLNQVKEDLENYPTKMIYAVCEVCGMEYVFRLVEGDLYLEPSDEEK